MSRVVKLLSLAGLGLALCPAFAQRSVPMRGNTPIAPQGLKIPPLPEEPVEYETAEGQNIRVRVYARGLENPYSIAFLPGGDKLVVERVGRLRLIRNDTLLPDPVAGVPEVRVSGFSGLMDVALHPDYDQNHYVYLSYSKPLDDNRSTMAIARGVWDGNALTDTRDVYLPDPPTGGGTRIAFGGDGKLYVITGGGDTQDPNSLGGKVLRLNDDGSVPADNPFVGMEGHRPEVFTMGHRSSLGLAMHPGTGEIWQTENGPNGGDEINILKPGGNYGWPILSFGRDYAGPWQSDVFWREGYEYPVVFWMPSIAVSGITFYTGDALPGWKGDVFVGGLRMGEIPGTGHVERILFNENMQELRREMLLVDLRQRIRDIRMGRDELLYVLTDSEDGAILRIEPAD